MRQARPTMTKTVEREGCEKLWCRLDEGADRRAGIAGAGRRYRGGVRLLEIDCGVDLRVAIWIR